MTALSPDLAAIAALGEAVPASGVTVFGETHDGEAGMHVRSCAPARGAPENPVCRSGDIRVAAQLRARGEARCFAASCRARQSMALGRDERVEIRFETGDIFRPGAR